MLSEEHCCLALSSADQRLELLAEDTDDDHLADAVVGEEVVEEARTAPLTALEEVGSFMYR